MIQINKDKPGNFNRIYQALGQGFPTFLTCDPNSRYDLATPFVVIIPPMLISVIFTPVFEKRNIYFNWAKNSAAPFLRPATPWGLQPPCLGNPALDRVHMQT